MATYIPPQRPGRDLLEASNMFAQWVIQLDEQKRRTQLAQSELQSEELRRQLMQQQQQQNQAQFQEWQDTSGIRRQTLETGLAAQKQQIASEQGRQQYYDVSRRTAEAQLGHLPLEFANQDELHKASMAKMQADLEGAGVNRDIAKLRMQFEGPLLTQQLQNAQQELQMHKAQEAAFRQQLLSGQQDQEWQNFGKAIQVFKELGDPAKQAAVRDSAAFQSPGVAKYLQMIPLGVVDEGKAIERIFANIESKAAAGDKEMQDAAAKLGAAKLLGPDAFKEMTTDKFGQTQMKYTGGDLVKTLQKALPALYGAKEAQPKTSGEAVMQQRLGEATGQPIGSDKEPSLQELPYGLRQKWDYLQKNSHLSNRVLSSNIQNPDPRWQSFLEGLPRGKAVKLAGGKTIHSENDRLIQGDVNYNQDIFTDLADVPPNPSTKFTRMVGYEDKSKNYHAVPILQDDYDRSFFRQNTVYDQGATVKQHVMYMSLLRELAKARNINNDKAATKILEQFYRAVGPSFLTKTQMDSLASFEKNYGWE